MRWPLGVESDPDRCWDRRSGALFRHDRGFLVLMLRDGGCPGIGAAPAARRPGMGPPAGRGAGDRGWRRGGLLPGLRVRRCSAPGCRGALMLERRDAVMPKRHDAGAVTASRRREVGQAGPRQERAQLVSRRTGDGRCPLSRRTISAPSTSRSLTLQSRASASSFSRRSVAADSRPRCAALPRSLGPGPDTLAPRRRAALRRNGRRAGAGRCNAQIVQAAEQVEPLPAGVGSGRSSRHLRQALGRSRTRARGSRPPPCWSGRTR